METLNAGQIYIAKCLRASNTRSAGQTIAFNIPSTPIQKLVDTDI